LPITADRLYREIEKKCKKIGINNPLDLPNPSLSFSDLQPILEARASEHSERDALRILADEKTPYHNGALFGMNPEVPGDEQDSKWQIRVVPDTEYLENPRLAGSAWLHSERRHRSNQS
jgi:hypothetical protein